MSDVTVILDRAGSGDRAAAEELLPLVYQELRRLAANRMAAEAPGHTLQPTALVHEAWLRLLGSDQDQWNGRNHFFMAAAEAMRRILVEHARRKQALKRGGGAERVEIESLDVAVQAADERLLALDEALQELAMHDATGARLIELRFFAGLSNAGAAEVLGLAERSATRAWTYARTWLYDRLKNSA